MFIGILIPVCDVRRFIPHSTGRLTVPVWPNADPTRDFIRGFGPVERRLRGGVESWPGEHLFANANRAVRFIDEPQNSRLLRCMPHPVAYLFRRFICGGDCVSRLELGFKQVGHWRKFRQQDWIKLIQRVLELRVRISNTETKLGLCGSVIAGHLIRSTSQHDPPIDTEPWWVAAGHPLPVIVHKKFLIEALPAHAESFVLDDLGLDVHFFKLTYASDVLDACLISEGREHDRPAARCLRVHLCRLYAERECLKRVLRLVSSGKIEVQRGTEASERLQHFLSQSLRLLTGRPRFGFDYPRLFKLASNLHDLITPSERESMLEHLSSIRRSLRIRLEKATEPVPTPSTVTVTQNLFVGENMSQFNNQNSKIGVQGDNATTSQISFDGEKNRPAKAVELAALAEELSMLRSQLTRTAQNDQDREAAGAIAEAEKCAKSGDREKTTHYLAKAGSWALQAATAIGTAVAAEAIKNAIR